MKSRNPNAYCLLVFLQDGPFFDINILVDYDIKAYLDHIKELSEENNKILKSIRRSNRIGGFFRFVYYVVIIGISIGAYVYLQPYLNSVMQMTQEIQNTNSKIQSTQNSFENGIKNLFFGSSSTTTSQ